MKMLSVLIKNAIFYKKRQEGSTRRSGGGEGAGGNGGSSQPGITIRRSWATLPTGYVGVAITIVVVAVATTVRPNG